MLLDITLFLLAQTTILATSFSGYILATYFLIPNSIQCLEYLDDKRVPHLLHGVVISCLWGPFGAFLGPI